MKRFTKKRNKGYIMPFQTQTQIDIEGENFILNYEGREKFHYKGKAIDKLAEYENFMEKNGFKNLQDLQTTVMDSREINKIQKENIKLKVKLEEINSKYILFKPSRGSNKTNMLLYVQQLEIEKAKLKEELSIYKIALEIASVDLNDEFYYTRKEIEERRKDRVKQYLEMAKDDKNSKK